MLENKDNVPFFLDFAFELPENVVIESKTQIRDCTTWGDAGCDDD